MSDKYLFVAEADKIQDLLFRSSKLREVAGGSVLLTEFCEEGGQLGEKMGGKTIISLGGSFRILFDSRDRAEEFGEYLSELYRRELGGTITAAEPVEVVSEKKAIEQAQENLRKAKHSGKPPISVEQMPYIAICASCGIGIARYYKKRHGDEKKNYLCSACEEKSKARERIKDKFLSNFLNHITDTELVELNFPDADEVAALESRHYIAYIVADVNNMGTIFGLCNNFKKLENLSLAVDKVIQESLAHPTKILRQKQNFKNSNLIPLLPLILGGDDVFALIPAHWALDFTQRFCQEFESRMIQALNELGIECNISPTISASVIICKGTYPYLIAHNLGEDLLKIAKKVAKEKKNSTISFKVITGNEIVKAPENDKKFIAGFMAYTIEELKKLIEYRLKLKSLPGTRRAQLENLFQKAEGLQLTSSTAPYQRMISEWIPERDFILKRLEETQRNALRDALKELGDEASEDNWQRIGEFYYHKLPDLLLAWDFAYSLEKDSSEYEEGEKRSLYLK